MARRGRGGPRRRAAGRSAVSSRPLYSPRATPSRRGSAPPSQPSPDPANAGEATLMPADLYLMAQARASGPPGRPAACPAPVRSGHCGWSRAVARGLQQPTGSSRARRSAACRTSPMMRDPPAEPRASTRRAVAVEHDGRRHRGARPLARLDPVGDRLAVRLRAPAQKSVSSLFSRKPRTMIWAPNGASMVVVKADGIAPAVDDAHVAGAALDIARRHAGADLAHAAIRRHQLAALREIGGRQQARRRHVHEGGIGDVAVAIGEGEPARLGDEMDRRADRWARRARSRRVRAAPAPAGSRCRPTTAAACRRRPRGDRARTPARA